MDICRDTFNNLIHCYLCNDVLVDNCVIQVEDFYRADATELERHIAELLQEKKKEALVADRKSVV